jgi:hypothetical protein
MAGSMLIGSCSAEKSPPTRVGLVTESEFTFLITGSVAMLRLRSGLIQDRSWTGFRRFPWALVVWLRIAVRSSLLRADFVVLMMKWNPAGSG